MIVMLDGDWLVHVLFQDGRRWRSAPMRWERAHELALVERRAGRRAYLAERRWWS